LTLVARPSEVAQALQLTGAVQPGKGAEVESYRARLQLLRSAMHAAVRAARLAGPSSMAHAAAQVHERKPCHAKISTVEHLSCHG
jgi:hypothetical protein